MVAASTLVLGLSACDSLKDFGTKLTASGCTWNLNTLAAQVVAVPVKGASLAAATPAVSAGAGGILLFGNMPGDLKAQLASLTSHAPNGHPPFVMADEEGGDIVRLSGVVTSLNSARWMADHWSADRIQQAARSLGGEMKALGVNMDLAPVLDLDARATHPGSANPDGNRSFGINPDKTSDDGVAFAKGLQAADVVPVVKHFPGLGYATGNTDYQAAQTRPWSELQNAGLKPFEAAIKAGVPAVMTSNASIPGLTSHPASVSPEVTDFLRNKLGFKGLIITDSLSAEALVADHHKTSADAAVAALMAGADLVLYGKLGTPPTEYNEVTTAIVNAVNAGTLPRKRLVEAGNAVLSAKHLSGCDS